MTRIIAIANQKGGVGKTTTVVNLGAALAERGYRTLLVDLDPQAALTDIFGIDPGQLEQSVYQLLLNPRLKAANLIQPTGRKNLDVLPANIHLAGAEIELSGQVGREYLLQKSLAPLKTRYEFILIDCSPSLGVLTINALTAADFVIVPLLCEYLALRGMGILFETITRVRERTNPRLRVLGILVTLFDGRALHSREVYEEVRSMFGDRVFDTVIRKSIRFSEASAGEMSLLEFAPDHAGALAYRRLAQEIVHERL